MIEITKVDEKDIQALGNQFMDLGNELYSQSKAIGTLVSGTAWTGAAAEQAHAAWTAIDTTYATPVADALMQIGRAIQDYAEYVRQARDEEYKARTADIIINVVAILILTPLSVAGGALIGVAARAAGQLLGALVRTATIEAAPAARAALAGIESFLPNGTLTLLRNPAVLNLAAGAAGRFAGNTAALIIDVGGNAGLALGLSIGNQALANKIVGLDWDPSKIDWTSEGINAGVGGLGAVAGHLEHSAVEVPTPDPAPDGVNPRLTEPGGVNAPHITVPDPHVDLAGIGSEHVTLLPDGARLGDPGIHTSPAGAGPPANLDGVAAARSVTVDGATGSFPGPGQRLGGDGTGLSAPDGLSAPRRAPDPALHGDPVSPVAGDGMRPSSGEGRVLGGGPGPETVGGLRDQRLAHLGLDPEPRLDPGRDRPVGSGPAADARTRGPQASLSEGDAVGAFPGPGRRLGGEGTGLSAPDGLSAPRRAQDPALRGAPASEGGGGSRGWTGGSGRLGERPAGPEPTVGGMPVDAVRDGAVSADGGRAGDVRPPAAGDRTRPSSGEGRVLGGGPGPETVGGLRDQRLAHLGLDPEPRLDPGRDRPVGLSGEAPVGVRRPDRPRIVTFQEFQAREATWRF